ncbi:MAG: hypothetical protein KGL44_04585 [Sphingomonadales bacterium]|nr:hypothetical protein [Sphingomonadales bacterium]
MSISLQNDMQANVLPRDSRPDRCSAGCTARIIGIWNDLTRALQEDIEELIQSEEYVVGVDPAPSIVNDVQRLMLHELEEQRNDDNGFLIDQVIAEERGQLPRWANFGLGAADVWISESKTPRLLAESGALGCHPAHR